MEQITTKDQLKRRLNIKNLGELKNQEVIERFRGIAKFVTPELFTELLRAAPEIAKAFTYYLASLNSFGQEIEKSKQQRWKCLMKAIETNQMTGDQILEAMQLLGGMDSRDTESFDRHREETQKTANKALMIAKAALAVAAAAAVASLAFITKGLSGKGDGSGEA